MADTYLSIGRNQPCWCGSRRKYKVCHGNTAPRHAPGAPLPADPQEGGIFLSPDTVVDPAVLMSDAEGTRLYMPGERERPRPESIADIVVQMTSGPEETTLPLKDLGAQRFEVLATFGLGGGSDEVASRLASLAPQDLIDLRLGMLGLARSTVGKLIELDAGANPPAVVWADAIPAARLLGQTLLWADHYLVPDDLGLSLLPDEPNLMQVSRAVTALHELRPLVEMGMVVPVLHNYAVALTHDAILARTQMHLDDRSTLNWVESQMLVEGPSAREVIFVSARDDISREAAFFMLGRIDPDSLEDHPDGGGSFGSHLLGPYRPGHDYSPWINQTKRQVAGSLVQDVTRELSIAEALGGTYVTDSLFRARLLDHLGGSTPLLATFWADVPVLPEASSETLALVASQDDAVQILRSTVGRVFRKVESATGQEQAGAIEDLVAEIESRSSDLSAEIRSNRRWDRVNATLAMAAIGVGTVVGGALGAAGGTVAAAKLVTSSLKRKSAVKRNDAFVFWLAESRIRPDRQ